jgi:glycosyltransferase involved in cell wall biosynthesis
MQRSAAKLARATALPPHRPATPGSLHRGSPDGAPGPALRVALLVRSSSWGGVEIHTLELARTLARQGHEVTIAEMGERVFAPALAGESLPIALTSIPLDRSPEDVGLRAWLRLLPALHADVGVFAKGWYFNASAAFELAARVVFPRYVVIEHLTPPTGELPRLRRGIGGLIPRPELWRLRRWAQLRVRAFGPERVIGVSRAVVNQLRSAYGFNPKKMVVVPNGVDCERFRPDPVGRAASRARWGIADGTVVFGTLGRLDVAHKGQNQALEALASLRARRPAAQFRYVLVGDGPDRERLEQQAAQLGVADLVVFAGPSAEPWAAHPGFDVFVLPSHYEGTPFALLEAMACGCPPVAMDVGGVGDVVSSPDVGWLVPAGDQAALLGAMEAALDAGDIARRTIGERARDHMLASFRADRQYAIVADLVIRP